MKHPTSRKLYQYWDGLRADRIAPRRFDIEPSAIAAELPYTLILERIDADVARFRLAGTRVVEAFGIEFRGVNIFDLFRDDDRLTLHRQLASVAREGTVSRLDIRADTAAGLVVDFEMLILPLVHAGNVIDRFLGCIVPLQSPAWLGNVPVRAIHLTASETIWPDGRPHALIEQGGAQAPFRANFGSAKVVRFDRRQFRVYEGGRQD